MGKQIFFLCQCFVFFSLLSLCCWVVFGFNCKILILVSLILRTVLSPGAALFLSLSMVSSAFSFSHSSPPPPLKLYSLT